MSFFPRLRRKSGRPRLLKPPVLNVANEQSFEHLVSIATKVSYDVSEMPCDDLQGIASGFLLKSTLTCRTILRIALPPRDIEYGKIYIPATIYDFPSAYILTRSVYENYINQYYLLLDDIDGTIRKFRVLAWRLHAAFERKTMLESIGSSKYIDDLNREIDLFSDEVKKLPYFKRLPRNKQERYLRKRNKWDDFNQTDVAVRSGIHLSQVKAMYKYTSNYVHSGPFAIQQILEVRSGEETKSLLFNPIWFSEMFLALTLDASARIFPPINEILSQDQYVMTILLFWKKYKSRDYTRVKEIPEKEDV